MTRHPHLQPRRRAGRWNRTPVPAITTIDTARLEQAFIKRAMELVRMHEPQIGFRNQPLPVIRA